MPQCILTSGLLVVQYELADQQKLIVEYIRNGDGYLEVESAHIEKVDAYFDVRYAAVVLLLGFQ